MINRPIKKGTLVRYKGNETKYGMWNGKLMLVHDRTEDTVELCVYDKKGRWATVAVPIAEVEEVV